MDSENDRFVKWTSIILEPFEKIELFNGSKTNRLSHNLNIYFPKIESKAIINFISKEIAIFANSACTTQIVESSQMLPALGHGEERIYSSIRIVERLNKKEYINFIIEKIIDTVKYIRNITN